MVDSAPVSDASKLARLQQFTKGKARESIKSCVHSRKGYVAAKQILKRRFGDPYLSTERLVTSLRNGKSVRSAEDIRQLADDLEGTFSTLTQLKTLTEIESQQVILDVVQRFPINVQHRWKRSAVEKRREENCYPNFKEFVKFINEEADDVTDPVYGTLGAKRSTCAASTQAKEESCSEFVSHACTAEPRAARRRLKCVYCGDSHKLLFCGPFKSLNVAERLKFVNDNGLCHICLMNNHTTNDCKRSYTCTVQACGLRHSKLLHVENARDASCVFVAQSNGGKSNGVFIPTVEVRVKGYSSFAVLDSASDTSFCTRALVRELGLHTRQCAIRLNTMSGSQRSKSDFVDLTIESADGFNSLRLSNVVVVERIPFNTPDVSIHDYPHLQDLHIPLPSSVLPQLLVGQDHAEALIPLDVRRGDEHQPFAVRTKFGWTVNGSTNASRKAPKVRAMSHFVSCSLENGDLSSLEERADHSWSFENESSCSKQVEFSNNVSDSHESIISISEPEEVEDDEDASPPEQSKAPDFQQHRIPSSEDFVDPCPVSHDHDVTPTRTTSASPQFTVSSASPSTSECVHQIVKLSAHDWEEGPLYTHISIKDSPLYVSDDRLVRVGEGGRLRRAEFNTRFVSHKHPVTYSV